MVKLKILFPSDYFDDKVVDEAYAEEMEIAKSLGFKCLLFPYDYFLETLFPYGNFSETGKMKISDSDIYAQPILYRGWMLNLIQYKNFEDVLHKKGYSLINNSQMYSTCHHFDIAYSYLNGRIDTPKTIVIKKHNNYFKWFDGQNGWKKLNLKEHFKNYFMIKDNVKSVKGTDFPDKISVDISTEEFIEIVNKFIELRGNLYSGSVVLKQYEPLKKYGNTTNEWRAFYFLNRLLTVSANSNQENNAPRVTDTILDFNLFVTLPSLFFTADYAETESGDWILIETGDGQVSGLSPNQNILEFYTKIKNYWEENKRSIK